MRIRPKYADIAATLALVISVTGGTAYAATLITSADIQDGTIQSIDVADGSLTGRDVRDGSIGTAELPEGSVNGVDIRDGSVGSVDVRDGTLGLVDINDLAEAALKGQKGDTGAPGQPGQPGQPGADGLNGVSGYVDVVSAWVNGVVGDTLTAKAVCPSGKKPVGGGFEAATGSMAFSPAYSHHITYPGDSTEVWEVKGHAVYNGVPGAAWSLQAWAVCATVS